MVKDTLVVLKEQLTPEMIEAGARLIEKLDESGVSVPLAMWFFDAEINEWRLLFSSPELSPTGSLPVYEKIQEIRKALGARREDVPFSMIMVLPPYREPIRWFKDGPRIGPDLSWVRMKKEVVDGHYIDDALIYRNVP